MRVTATVKGDKAEAALTRLGADLSGPRVLTPVARDMERRARALAPRRTGRLAASVRGQAEAGRVALLAGASYAKYPHWGTKYVRRYPFLLIAAKESLALDAAVSDLVRGRGLA